MASTSLTGTIVAITGAARGIGFESAQAFAAADAQVTIGGLDRAVRGSFCPADAVNLPRRKAH